MPPSREHPRARSLAILAVAVSTAVATGATPATAAGSAPAQPLPARSGAAATPVQVPSSVQTLDVPRVSAKSALAAPRLATAARGDTLVAHLTAPSTQDFSLTGVTWEPGTAQPGTVVRVRSYQDGAWTSWTDLHVDPDEELADAADTATVRDGTEPVWVGDSTGVEVAVYSPDGSTPSDLKVSAIDPGTSTYDATALSGGSTDGVVTEESTTAASGRGFPAMPRIITRRGWGADESMGDECWDPKYGTTFKTVVVHHTVGTNSYDPDESAAIVRGIYAYHTQSRGWCDIGYNFLVDRYGKVFEGRRGGIRRPVRGAHAGDYNVDTTGISLMGNFEEGQPTKRMKTALVKLIAWRMGTAYHGAYGRAYVYDRKIKRITGHRDVMSTACPGANVYEILPNIRRRVENRLGDYVSPIERRWRNIGAGKSRYGSVAMGERGQGDGHWTVFQGGRMYSSDAGVKAFPRSAVLKKYIHSGHVTGRLGYPRRAPHKEAGGWYAVFDGGRIYNSPRTRPRALYRGPILKRFRQTGGVDGRLGYPTTGSRQTKSGTITRFENGWISWNSSTKRTRVRYS